MSFPDRFLFAIVIYSVQKPMLKIRYNRLSNAARERGTTHNTWAARLMDVFSALLNVTIRSDMDRSGLGWSDRDRHSKSYRSYTARRMYTSDVAYEVAHAELHLSDGGHNWILYRGLRFSYLKY
jgi:hypothetical protein